MDSHTTHFSCLAVLSPIYGRAEMRSRVQIHLTRKHSAVRRRVEGEDDAGSDPERPGSPPPIASTSRPSTPTKAAAATSYQQAPVIEGKDTKKLRERVAAMKPPGDEGETAETTTTTTTGDVEIADVAAEVSNTAAKLGDEQAAKEDKDVEIAEVAAEVGSSAQQVDQQDEQVQKDEEDGIGAGESKERADTAAEVAESAAEVQATDERIADTADEVAEAAKAAPEPTPAPTPKPAAAQPVRPIRLRSVHGEAKLTTLCPTLARGFTDFCQLLLRRVSVLGLCFERISPRLRLDGQAGSRSAEAESQIELLGLDFLCLERSPRCSSRVFCEPTTQSRVFFQPGILDAFHQGSSDHKPRLGLAVLFFRLHERVRRGDQDGPRFFRVQRLFGSSFGFLQPSRCDRLGRRPEPGGVRFSRTDDGRDGREWQPPRRAQSWRTGRARRVQARLYREEGARHGRGGRRDGAPGQVQVVCDERGAVGREGDRTAQAEPDRRQGGQAQCSVG